MAKVTAMSRPKRWDTPFDPNMQDTDFDAVMAFEQIQSIDKNQFPSWIPLEGIIRNDTRIVHYQSGDIILRKDSYGSSTFLVLNGATRVLVTPSLPQEMLGREVTKKRSVISAFSQLFTNNPIPEARNTQLYDKEKQHLRSISGSGEVRSFLPDINTIIKNHKTVRLSSGSLVGEIAALSRVPRTATVFAETDTTLLEIRWQGLREICKYNSRWKQQVDSNYRKNMLAVHLYQSRIFSQLEPATLDVISNATLFESYGSFDWYQNFNRDNLHQKRAQEPVIVQEGEYADGLFIVCAGLARASIKLGAGQQTLFYLQEGDTFGMDKVYEAWKGEGDGKYRVTLTALSYVDILRVPSHILEKHIFPNMQKPKSTIKKYIQRKLSDSSLMEWAVDERFVNGTKTMLIDMDRCTRCDDCVSACANAHDGNSRFIRHGKQMGKWMVANACMHCSDPVCMIGCPTGAISRTVEGIVKINDMTCIGCSVCANSCPFNNIQLVEIKDLEGNPVTDEAKQQPIMKATNCDLCIDQLGGPACARACPHGALERVELRDHTQMYMESTV